MNSTKTLNIIITALLAFLVNSVVYLGFANTYSSKIFNHIDFVNQFQSGVYQYRILSGHLLLGIYDILNSLNINYDLFKLKFLDENADPQMYLSFYILNSFFAILTASVFSYLLQSKWVKATESEQLLLSCFAITIMAITQFVVVPYDYSSYFLLLIFIVYLLKYLDKVKTKTFILMVIILLIATINRESSALLISFAAALLFSIYRFHKRSIIPIALLGLAFISAYLGLRFSDTNPTTNDGNLLIENITQPKNWLGALFSTILLLLTLKLCTDSKQKNIILLFHIFATPYIIMCFYTGILYEIRLYIPLFLGSLLISKIDIEAKNTN